MAGQLQNDAAEHQEHPPETVQVSRQLLWEINQALLAFQVPAMAQPKEREWQVSVSRYFVQHVAELMRAVQIAAGAQPDETLVTD